MLASKPIKLNGINELVRASIGVSTILPGDSMELIVGRADKALYRAKAGGKNRVEVAYAEAADEHPKAVSAVIDQN